LKANWGASIFVKEILLNEKFLGKQRPMGGKIPLPSMKRVFKRSRGLRPGGPKTFQ